MKKIIFSMSALLMMVSCMNENETTPVVTGDKISYFTAGFEAAEADDAEDAPESKTILNKDNNFAVTWVAEDPVTISDGSQSYLFKAVSTGLTTTLSPVEASLELPAGKTYYAHYPSDANSTWNGSKVTFTTPSVVTPNYGTFPYNASVAATNSSDFTFKNVGALIRFRVNRSNVTKVVFEAAGGEYLAGEVTVDCANPADIAVTPGKGSTSVTVNGTLASNQDYYIPVLPVTFSKGLTVTIYLSNTKIHTEPVYFTRTTQSFTLSRSSRVEMGYLTLYDPNDTDTFIPDEAYTPLPPRGSVIDSTAPGGYYFPLACGIDVAGADLETDGTKTWRDYCDPDKVLTKNPTTGEIAPVNPCPAGWSLPTSAQLTALIADNVIDKTVTNNPGYDYFYWKMRNGERSNGDIFGALYDLVEVRVLSCETYPGKDNQIYRLQVNRSSTPSLKISNTGVTTTVNASTSTENYKSILRCVRQAAN